MSFLSAKAGVDVLSQTLIGVPGKPKNVIRDVHIIRKMASARSTPAAAYAGCRTGKILENYDQAFAENGRRPLDSIELNTSNKPLPIGRHTGIPIDRLLRFLMLLGNDVKITVKAQSRSQARLRVA